MENETSRHVKIVEKCSVSVTPFSINDILNNKLEPTDDESDLQVSALDMSKSQISGDGKNMTNFIIFTLSWQITRYRICCNYDVKNLKFNDFYLYFFIVNIILELIY